MKKFPVPNKILGVFTLFRVKKKYRGFPDFPEIIVIHFQVIFRAAESKSGIKHFKFRKFKTVPIFKFCVLRFGSTILKLVNLKIFIRDFNPVIQNHQRTRFQKTHSLVLVQYKKYCIIFLSRNKLITKITLQKILTKTLERANNKCKKICR